VVCIHMCGCIGDAAVDQLAQLSWIPMSTRMRILKREMDTLRHNSDRRERLEEDLKTVRVATRGRRASMSHERMLVPLSSVPAAHCGHERGRSCEGDGASAGAAACASVQEADVCCV
jgi:hypothetical protein